MEEADVFAYASSGRACGGVEWWGRAVGSRSRATVAVVEVERLSNLNQRLEAAVEQELDPTARFAAVPQQADLYEFPECLEFTIANAAGPDIAYPLTTTVSLALSLLVVGFLYRKKIFLRV